jgi:hypothetical protein
MAAKKIRIISALVMPSSWRQRIGGNLGGKKRSDRLSQMPDADSHCGPSE